MAIVKILRSRLVRIIHMRLALYRSFLSPTSLGTFGTLPSLLSFNHTSFEMCRGYDLRSALSMAVKAIARQSLNVLSLMMITSAGAYAGLKSQALHDGMGVSAGEYNP